MTKHERFLFTLAGVLGVLAFAIAIANLGHFTLSKPSEQEAQVGDVRWKSGQLQAYRSYKRVGDVDGTYWGCIHHQLSKDVSKYIKRPPQIGDIRWKDGRLQVYDECEVTLSSIYSITKQTITDWWDIKEPKLNGGR